MHLSKIYLSTFDELHWVAASVGREFIDLASAKLPEVNLVERGR